MKKNTVALAGVCLSLLALTGCTEIEVRKMPSGVIEGIPYSLPRKTFLVSLEYELKDCSAARSPDQRTVTFNLEIDKAVTVVPVTEPDEKERFYIPYSSLRNWFKNTDVTVEAHDNQTLKSVAATVTDRTAETITAGIGTALRIASIASGVKVRGDVAAHDVSSAYCGAAARQALERIKALRKPNPSQEELAELARLKSAVTHKEFISWTPAKPSIASSPPVKLSTEIYPDNLVGIKGKWVTAQGIAHLKAQEPSEFLGERIRKLLTTVSLNVNVAVLPDPEALPKGFLLRQGPTGLLRVCNGLCPATVDGDVTDVLKANEHVIPQLGQYVVIPLKNRLFENQTLTITVSGEGAITKLGLKNDAVAPAALTTINNNLDAIAKAKEAHDKAKADARTATLNSAKDHAAQLAAEHNAIAECLKAQDAVRQAGGRVSGTCQ